MRIHKRTDKLVSVEFLDHGTAAGWAHDHEVDYHASDNVVRAVGWIVFEDNGLLVLGSFQRIGGTETHSRQYIVKGRHSIIDRKVVRLP